MAILAGRTGEELTRPVETAQSGGRGDVVYARAAADERLGRVAETKRQRRHQGRRPRAGAFRFERGAEIDEHVDERRLHARLRRRRARHEHAHRRAFAAIHVRKSVDLGAGLQQHRRDGHGIGRRFLTVAFDAVRRDVVQQGRPVARRIEFRDARRTGPNEVWMRAEQRRQQRLVSIDHRFDG